MTCWVQSLPFTHALHSGRFSAQTRSQQQQILHIIQERGGSSRVQQAEPGSDTSAEITWFSYFCKMYTSRHTGVSALITPQTLLTSESSVPVSPLFHQEIFVFVFHFRVCHVRSVIHSLVVNPVGELSACVEQAFVMSQRSVASATCILWHKVPPVGSLSTTESWKFKDLFITAPIKLIDSQSMRSPARLPSCFTLLSFVGGSLHLCLSLSLFLSIKPPPI